MDDGGIQFYQTVQQWEREEMEQDPQYLEWIEAQEQEYRQWLEAA